MNTIKVALLSLLGMATVASPSFAADWNEQFDLCVAAMEIEGFVDTENYDAKFVSGSGGATKRILIKFTANNGGENVVAECRVRGTTIRSVTLKA